jgi:hypothetical protein
LATPRLQEPLRRKGTRRHLRAARLWVCYRRLSTLWKTLRTHAPQWSAQPLLVS